MRNLRKVSAVKPNKPKLNSKQRADALGHSYEEATALIDQGDAQVRDCKERVLVLVGDSPDVQKSPKGVFVMGNEFLVGYYNRAGSSKLDTKRMMEEHPVEYALCLKKVTVFDEDEFIRMIDEGKIAKKLVKKLTVTGDPTQVVYIKRKSERA